MSGHALHKKPGQDWMDVPCSYCGQKPGTASLAAFMSEECPHTHDDDESIIMAIDGTLPEFDSGGEG